MIFSDSELLLGMIVHGPPLAEALGMDWPPGLGLLVGRLIALRCLDLTGCPGDPAIYSDDWTDADIVLAGDRLFLGWLFVSSRGGFQR